MHLRPSPLRQFLGSFSPPYWLALFLRASQLSQGLQRPPNLKSLVTPLTLPEKDINCAPNLPPANPLLSIRFLVFPALVLHALAARTSPQLAICLSNQQTQLDNVNSEGLSARASTIFDFNSQVSLETFSETTRHINVEKM